MTHLLACIYQREDEDISERGFFKKAYWKPDSTAIAVTTSKNFVCIFNVEISRESSFNLHDPVGENTDFTRESTELFMNKSRPHINVNLAVVARLESTPTCILTFKEELFVCLKDGWLHRLSWSGNILHELSFNIRSIQQEQTSNNKNQRKDVDYFVSDISPFLGGICIVYSDGKAALVVSSISEFRPGSISVLFAGGLNDACCCSTNFKFRLLYFGCKNGEIAAYSTNDVDGGLIQLFRIGLSIKDGTELLEKISSIRQINCLSPSGDAFAVLWDSKQNSAFSNHNGDLINGDAELIFAKTNSHHMSCPSVLAIFSPFGEQWWCSLEDSTIALGKNRQSNTTLNNYGYSSMDWSLEGYQLWLGTSNGNLHLINIVKSIQSIHDAMVFVGSDRIFERSLFLTGGLDIFGSFILCAACNLDTKDELLYVFRIEDQLDVELAHFISTNRILQMKICNSFLLTFGVDSMISIYSLSISDMEQLQIECIAEIRVAEFLHHPNFSLISMELAKLNFHSDALSFCSDLDSLLINASGHLLLLSPMESSVQQLKGQHKEISNENILEFQLHPPTLVASYVEEFWVVHPFSCSSFFRDEKYNFTIPYLSEALWINAGCRKFRLWLPLSIDSQDKNISSDPIKLPQLRQNSRAFISRRIMIPFSLEIYPFYIDHNYLACGANVTSLSFSNITSKIASTDDISTTSELTEGDSLSDFVSLAKSDDDAVLSVRSLTKTYEVFIHKLIKQLLKRNLGSYAFDLASACRSISYFGHILELLLHDLLDEEASSSEPIPDPLLPRVVSFLREFPDEYLPTIIHCARKTELAFWNLLFFVSNHPRQLFQMCLEESRLELATSCLVILHSLTSIDESSRLACKLLEEAKRKQRWKVAQDIIRFMRNINRATEKDSDLENVPTSPIQGKLTSFHHQHVTPPFNLSNDELSFPLFSSQVEIDENELLAMECGHSTEMKNGRKHPWAVSLMTKGRNKLGGSVISPFHVLTVAHGFVLFDNSGGGPCEVSGYRRFSDLQSSWSVAYGSDCIREEANDPACAKANITHSRIRAIYIDDGFADGECINGHDWAIVELEDRIKFSDVVQPICLPMKGQIPADAFHKGDILIREIPMRHDAGCKKRPWADSEDYLCAKALNPRDFRTLRTCHGDSGSGMEDVRNLKRVHLTSVRNIRILNNNMTHDLSKNVSRQILHSPLAVPQLEFMRSWSNAKKKRQRLRRNIKTKKDSSTSINDKIISSVSSDDSLKVGMVCMYKYIEYLELIGITSYGSRQCASNEDNVDTLFSRKILPEKQAEFVNRILTIVGQLLISMEAEKQYLMSEVLCGWAVQQQKLSLFKILVVVKCGEAENHRRSRFWFNTEIRILGGRAFGLDRLVDGVSIQCLLITDETAKRLRNNAYHDICEHEEFAVEPMIGHLKNFDPAIVEGSGNDQPIGPIMVAKFEDMASRSKEGAITEGVSLPFAILVGPKIDVDAKLFMERSFADFVIHGYCSNY
uniref:Protein RIC1 homolog n=1 Tax=Meloidogyne javanica TaxID=6303 RepID=A0A915MCQ4_MELJA